MKTKAMYVATVQILIDCDNPAAAADGISAIFEACNDVVDWSYLKVGGQYFYPTERIISEPYQEGEAFFR